MAGDHVDATPVRVSERSDTLAAVYTEFTDETGSREEINAEIECLTAELTDRGRVIEQIREEQAVNVNEDDDGSETASV